MQRIQIGCYLRQASFAAQDPRLFAGHRSRAIHRPVRTY